MAERSLLVAIRLQGPQVAMIRMLGQRGGEISWDWSKCRPDVVRMMRELIDDKGMVSDLTAQGRIRLTDRGREALAQIERAASRPLVVGI